MVINRFYLPLVNILLIMVYTNGDYMVIIWLMMVNNLVAGWPPPLKNHGVKASWDGDCSQLNGKIKMFQTTNKQHVCLTNSKATHVDFLSLCAFCREVVPTKPFTNTALYYKMMLESEPTPLATKWFGGFYDGSKANVGHYKMTLRNHFVVKTGCHEKSWFATKWGHSIY